MLHFHHAPGTLSETHLLEHAEAIFGVNCCLMAYTISLPEDGASYF
jgi:hypothetical protein